MVRYTALLALPLLAFGQTPAPIIGPPALGYVFDPQAKAIRLVSGVPGAAGLDAVVDPGTALDAAWICPSAHLAVANTKDGSVGLIDWSAAPKVTALSSSVSRLTQAAFDPGGKFLAISDGHAVELWTALTGTPSKSGHWTSGDSLTALAVSTTGAVIAAAASGNLVELGDEARVLVPGLNASALAWMPGAVDLAAAGPGALTIVHAVLSASAAVAAAKLTAAPSALAISSDGLRAAVASSDGVTLVLLADGSATTLAAQVSTLDPLAGNLVLHGIDSGTGAALLLDADRAPASVTALVESAGAAQLGVAQ